MMSSALYAESCGSGEERFGRRGGEGGWGVGRVGGGGLSGLDVGTLGGAGVSGRLVGSGRSCDVGF